MWPEESDTGARRKITPDHLRRPGIPTRRELMDRYAALTGFGIADMKFYETLAIYKLAIILEGIFSRYKRGQTSDPRFLAIGERMAVTAQAAHENIRASRSSVAPRAISRSRTSPAATCSDSNVPASVHHPSITSYSSCPFAIYALFTSVISSSLRAEGFSVCTMSHTCASYM
jgi:hypothetical protein